MWTAKMRQLQSDDNRMMLTLFGVCQSKILATSLDEPIRVVREIDGAPASWDKDVLDDWRLGDLRGDAHPVGKGIVAAMLGDAFLLREVFCHGGADVAVRHKATGATTMMQAAGTGDVDAVAVLAELASATCDADKSNMLPLIDVGTTKFNITPLDRAIRCNHTDVVHLLLRLGARHDVTRSSGCTPLHAAASMGRVECLHALLEAGADIDAANNDGATPLDLSSSSFTLFGSQRGKTECARVLTAAHKVNQNLRDKAKKKEKEEKEKEPPPTMAVI
jgi:hypothetical protein